MKLQEREDIEKVILGVFSERIDSLTTFRQMASKEGLDTRLLDIRIDELLMMRDDCLTGISCVFVEHKR